MLQFIDTVIGIIWCIMYDELEHVLTICESSNFDCLQP